MKEGVGVMGEAEKFVQILMNSIGSKSFFIALTNKGRLFYQVEHGPWELHDLPNFKSFAENQ